MALLKDSPRISHNTLEAKHQSEDCRTFNYKQLKRLFMTQGSTYVSYQFNKYSFNVKYQTNLE